AFVRSAGCGTWWIGSTAELALDQDPAVRETSGTRAWSAGSASAALPGAMGRRRRAAAAEGLVRRWGIGRPGCWVTAWHPPRVLPSFAVRPPRPPRGRHAAAVADRLSPRPHSYGPVPGSRIHGAWW